MLEDNQNMEFESKNFKEDTPLQCPRCEVYFNQHVDLEEHMLHGHDRNNFETLRKLSCLEGSFKMACTGCGNVLKDQNDLSTHLESCTIENQAFNLPGHPKPGPKPMNHLGGMKYYCIHCQREYGAKSSLRAHHKRIHMECEFTDDCIRFVERRFVCRREDCNYLQFQSWEQLYLHFLRHHYNKTADSRPIVSISTKQSDTDQLQSEAIQVEERVEKEAESQEPFETWVRNILASCKEPVSDKEILEEFFEATLETDCTGVSAQQSEEIPIKTEVPGNDEVMDVNSSGQLTVASDPIQLPTQITADVNFDFETVANELAVGSPIGCGSTHAYFEGNQTTNQ